MYTYTLVALGANELNLARIDCALGLENLALVALATSLYMLGYDVRTLNDDLTFLGRSGNNLALYTLGLTGENDNGIAGFDMKLFHYSVPPVN